MAMPLDVLFVEDSQRDTELLLALLEDSGYCPRGARIDTAEALETALEARNWDLVIADHSMPHFSSDTALRLVKERGLDIPFILVSGTIGEDVAVAAMKAGAHDYIMKDNLTRLIPAIKRELREAEERRGRRALEQSMEEFLRGATHDLKNPLTVILGLSRHLQRHLDTLEPKTVRDRLGTIETTAGRMVTLINRLVETGSLESLRLLDLERHPTDLVALAQHVVAQCQQGSDAHCFSLVTAVPKLIGMWDVYLLERVLGNLLVNAMEYSPDGGHINVAVAAETQREDPWAVLTVQDHGLGISVSDLPHVFERSYRGGNVVHRIAGAGLGLAGVQQIVGQHGGTIAVESEESRGTTLTVRLPITAPGAEMPPRELPLPVDNPDSLAARSSNE